MSVATSVTGTLFLYIMPLLFVTLMLLSLNYPVGDEGSESVWDMIEFLLYCLSLFQV